jgi:hypothetical protein
VSQKFLLSADLKDTPGRVKLTFLEITVEYAPNNRDFDARPFNLLDADHPIVQVIKESFK